MTHTHDESPRPRGPLDFPPGLGLEERVARWAHLMQHEDEVSDEALDAALYEMMDNSRRAT